MFFEEKKRKIIHLLKRDQWSINKKSLVYFSYELSGTNPRYRRELLITIFLSTTVNANKQSLFKTFLLMFFFQVFFFCFNFLKNIASDDFSVNSSTRRYFCEGIFIIIKKKTVAFIGLATMVYV